MHVATQLTSTISTYFLKQSQLKPSFYQTNSQLSEKRLSLHWIDTKNHLTTIFLFFTQINDNKQNCDQYRSTHFRMFVRKKQAESLSTDSSIVIHLFGIYQTEVKSSVHVNQRWPNFPPSEFRRA